MPVKTPARARRPVPSQSFFTNQPRNNTGQKKWGVNTQIDPRRLFCRNHLVRPEFCHHDAGNPAPSSPATRIPIKQTQGLTITRNGTRIPRFATGGRFFLSTADFNSDARNSPFPILGEHEGGHAGGIPISKWFGPVFLIWNSEQQQRGHVWVPSPNDLPSRPLSIAWYSSVFQTRGITNDCFESALNY